MVQIRDCPPEALSALLEASQAINSAQGLDETLQAIAKAAAGVMRAEAASVIMLDPAREKQVFRAAHGGAADQLLGVEYPAGEGISGRVLNRGRAEIANDVATDASHHKGIDARSGFTTRSLIAAPLINRGRRLGVVEVLNPIDGGRFGEAERGLCEVFANLAAVATANAQLLDRLDRENQGLKDTLAARRDLVGASPGIERVRGLIDRVAPSRSTVLLLGETGTGKELAAEMIHARSPRAERPFVAVSCASLPETLLESELFGHEAGAFTGAVKRRIGRFELADGGTLFLDEIAELPLNVQVKLLRVLQERAISRLGSSQTLGVDVRILAATNRDLTKEIEAGRFRQDLFYRLNVFPILMPPLRDRPDDVPLLAEALLGRVAAEVQVPTPALSPQALARLQAYDFPGNVRELQNILERACLLAAQPGGEAGVIGAEHLPRNLLAGVAAEGEAPASRLEGQERALILEALEAQRWNQTQAARTLGINRDALRYRMKKYGLRRPRR